MSAITTSLPALERLRSAAERSWERIDRSMLRLQGRLDSPSYDRWLPYGFAALQIGLLITLVLARFHQLDHGLEGGQAFQIRQASIFHNGILVYIYSFVLTNHYRHHSQLFRRARCSHRPATF